MNATLIRYLKNNDFTILISLYFVLLPIGKTLWYPLFFMALIGFFAFLKEVNEGGLGIGTKWLLLGGSFIWIPSIFSVLDTVDFGRTLQFVGTYPLFFLAGYFIYKRLSVGVSIMPAVYIISLIVVFWGVLAIWQYVDPTNPFGPGGVANQGIHTRDNPYVDGGLMMGVILGSLFAFLVFALWSRGFNRLAVVFSVFLIALVYISGTRSAWLSVLVTLCAFPLVAVLRGYKPSKKNYLVSLLLLLSVAVTGSFVFQQPGIRAKLDQTLIVFSDQSYEGLNRALSGRVDIWSDAVQVGLSSPLVGTGVNNFRYAQPMLSNPAATFAITRWNKDGHEFKGPSHTHQILLEAWSGAGALGLIGILAYFTWLAKTSIQIGKSGSLLAIGSLVALWAGFFPLNSHNNFYGGWMSAWFWVWMGISAGLIFRHDSKTT